MRRDVSASGRVPLPPWRRRVEKIVNFWFGKCPWCLCWISDSLFWQFRYSSNGMYRESDESMSGWQTKSIGSYSQTIHSRVSKHVPGRGPTPLPNFNRRTHRKQRAELPLRPHFIANSSHRCRCRSRSARENRFKKGKFGTDCQSSPSN